jgi:hypothetical protein
MQNDWILDVLVDLKTFARANGMRSLAAQLDDAALVAQVELASATEENGFGLCGQERAAGWADRTAGVG